MQLNKSESGYFYFERNGVKVILFLTEELFPEDASLEKLVYISQQFPVHERIIALPDLHFKVKNFVPSGMTIPLEKGFSPLLLGPNNDGMGSVRFHISGEHLDDKLITTIFEKLKQRIAMFRRTEDIVSREMLETIFQRGITDLAGEWGFADSELSKFEDRGCARSFSGLNEISEAFQGERPDTLPSFVPGHDIWERGRKCLGVLDGTSHFIELYKADRPINKNAADNLGYDDHSYFFLVHAGAGDICLISHRTYLNAGQPFLSWESELGQNAYNAFAVSANYGFANRLYIYKIIRDVLQETLQQLDQFELVSDIPHDYLQQNEGDLFVHRKGATKLAAAGTFDSSHPYAQTGMPYLFPSSAGGDAYLIANAPGNATAFHTVSHGAGRLLRKDSAIERFSGNDFENDLQNKILLFRYGVDQIEGQHPKAFKDIEKVMALLERFNLAHPIMKLKPLASLKA